MNERTEIVPTELDLEQILNGVKRARFFVGLKVVLKHEQNLPPADRPIGCGLGLLEVDDLACQIPFCDARKG